MTIWMTIITVVLVFFFIMITGILFLRITATVQSTLRNYSSENYASKSFEVGAGDQSSENYAIDPGSICVVSINESGTRAIVDSGHGWMDEEILVNSISYVMKEDSAFGIILKYNLFYYKTNISSGSRIAFADASPYYAYLTDALVYDGVIFLVILLGLFFATSKLSTLFLKPVEKAWAQQQNFIADASHELKTPLTVILANSNILLSHSGDTIEEQKKWIESTNEEAAHMKDLVDKMLFLAKSENMKNTKVFSEVPISDLTKKLILQFEPVAFEAGVTIADEIEKNVIIRADSTAVNQIIHILIDNAVKYAGLGGTVTVRLYRKKDNVFLVTKNTGSPIPPEDLPHIFERFYRSDKARTFGSGYGLGLAICKSLAESQHATIGVVSDEEHGTEFTVRFQKQKTEKTAV